MDGYLCTIDVTKKYEKDGVTLNDQFSTYSKLLNNKTGFYPDSTKKDL